MEHKKETLTRVIGALAEKGDDREELSYWVEIFDTLDETQQNELLAILEKELQTLEKF